MAINWCYNEPWVTAAGTSIIAYPSKRKPAYYSVQNALRPVLPSARFDHFVYTPGDVLTAELWLLNDTYECVSDTVEVYLTIDGNKKHVMTWNTGESEPNSNIKGHTLAVTVPNVETQIITLELEGKKHGTSKYTLLIKNDPPQNSGYCVPDLV